MTSEEIFKLCNSISMFTWIALTLLPYQRWLHRIIIGIIVALFCVLYTSIVLPGLGTGDLESFGSLGGVMQLFTNDKAVLAGWIHYLAFDLMTGLYIVNNAMKYDINRFVLLPCLFFTFMLGPIGLLMFLIVRTIKTRRYFLDYSLS